MQKKALLVGASGLVGSELLSLLLQDNFFSEVKIFVRKTIPINHPKLQQTIVDFDKLENLDKYIDKDIAIVYCCLGTTIKKAGSQKAFTTVDYTYVSNIASIARKKEIQTFAIVSSLGANPNSANFYLKVKGEIEFALQNLTFKNLVIVRPSMLLGNRNEFRLGEWIGKFFMQLFSFIFMGNLKKYKAIQAKTVAKALIELTKKNDIKLQIVESDKLQEVGKEH